MQDPGPIGSANAQNFVLTADQAELDLQLRKLLGTAIADRYADFCRLASGALPLKTSRPLASHALRELDSSIRHVLAVPLEAVARDDPAQESLRREACLKLKAMGFPEDAVQRSDNALRPRMTHKTQIRRIVERLGLAPDGDIAKLWISLNDAHGDVHKRSFHESMEADDDFRERYARRFDTVLRQLLVQLQSRYAPLMLRAQEIAEMPPQRGIKLFVGEIPGAIQIQGHFYASLTSEEWLPWLAKEGLLAEPLYDPIVGDALRLWTWPVGHYLVRLAKSRNAAIRGDVAAAIRALEGSTNPDVHRFGMSVVEALPGEEAAGLADVVANWLTPDHPPYAGDPHKLIAKLATSGLVEPALTVARALFQVFERDGRLATLFDATMYEHHLNEAVAKFADADPVKAMPVFCEILRQASVIERRFSGVDAEDHSYFTVGSLADDTVRGHDFHGSLIVAIVQLEKAAVGRDPTRVAEVHRVLEGFRGKIYRRMRVFAVSLAPGNASDLARSYLLDVGLLDWCRSEYAALARAWFPSLTEEDQARVLEAVDEIPREFFERWKTRYAERQGRPITEAEQREYYATETRDLLWSWKDALPPKRRAELEAVVAEFGGPDDRFARFAARSESPLSRISIQGQSVEETISFLHAWRPRPDLQTQTISALANELREAAAADPTLFSASAAQFAPLRPIFVRRLLEGIARPAAGGTNVDWKQLLELADLLLARSEAPYDPADAVEGDDPDWSLALGAIVDVLASGLRRGAEGVDFDLADTVRSTVLALHDRTRRLPPTDPERFKPEHPYFSAQQTAYGAAVELCLLWLFWQSKDPGSATGKAPLAAIENAPEMRGALEDCLKDRSFRGRIARGILGRYLGWLCYFGEEWTRREMRMLFPEDDADLRAAAWISHLQSDAGPVGPLLDEMDGYYAEQIAALGRAATEDDATDHRLAEYLMVRFLWDKLPKGLLEQFWANGSDSLRRHAMWFMGRQLGGSIESHRERAKLYWNRRLELAAASNDPDSYRRELGTIGQWFLWKIDETWLMDQLLLMLNAGFSPNDGIGIIDKLAEHILDRLDRVIEITKALVRHSKMESWIFGSQADSLRKILVEGKASPSPLARDGVQEIVGILSSRGNTGFLDLAD